MRKPKYALVLIVLAALLAAGSPSLAASVESRANILARPAALTGPSAPSLGTAQSFAILAGSTATNTGDSTVTGDLGVSPGSAVTGFPPGIVTGGTIHTADALAAQAQSAVATAYSDLASRACDVDLTGQDLGGLTLVPGVYCFSTSAQLTGALVLDAQGDSSGVFIFKIGSTLTTASGSSVTLINGGNQCNVFWQVGSSATLGSSTAFAGNILALMSISLNNGAGVVGRLLAYNGAVTLINNTVSNQCWTSQIPTATATAEGPTPTATVGPTAAPTNSPVAAPTNAAPTVVPTNAPTTTPTSTPTTPAVSGVPGTGSVALPRGEGQFASLKPFVVSTSTQPSITEPLIAPDLDLDAAPVNVPLELRIPSLQISAPVVGVGITSKNVMDAPQGLADDPVWQTAFWYRGSGIPGESGTATIAGHVDGIHGRPALFAHLKDLGLGDLVIVHDTRSDLDIRFIVTEVVTYSVQQANDPAVLARIYGSGPVAGEKPEPASDGLSHLTLITCSGDFVNGSYDHRLVVYAQRVQATPKGTQLLTSTPRCGLLPLVMLNHQ